MVKFLSEISFFSLVISADWSPLSEPAIHTQGLQNTDTSPSYAIGHFGGIKKKSSFPFGVAQFY